MNDKVTSAERTKYDYLLDGYDYVLKLAQGIEAERNRCNMDSEQCPYTDNEVELASAVTHLYGRVKYHPAAMQPPASSDAGEVITGRQFFTDWTESNGGMMKGGYGFLNHTSRREWEYCASRINQAINSMRLALIRAFFTLEWISSRVDGIDQPAIEYRMKDISSTLGMTEGELWDLGFTDDDMKGSQG